MRYGGICYHCNYDTNPNSLNFSDYPPQPRYETNICELCGNDAHFGYDCSLQVPFDYNQNPCFDQNFDNNFPLTSPQQYLYCENCGGPHETFQCQPLNQNFYEPNSSGFDQFQPPQYSVIHHPPQETSKEILQAREDLMEAIEAFLKEYDHIPPNEKCMALLLAEERFLKIKQAVEEEQNQPEVMQELLLKLMKDLQILKGIQPKQEKPATQSFTPYGNFSMFDDVKVLMRDIYTFLRKFSRIPFGVTPKVILIAWERFGEIKHALTDKQYRQEDIQELISKLLEDVRNINEELSEYINCPSWNRPTFYDDDDDEYTIIYRKPKAITPVLPIEEPDNSLIMGDEHLNTIPETESDEVIKSSVENLVPIPSEFEGISDNTCDMPVCEDPLSDHSEILSDSNNDDTSNTSIDSFHKIDSLFDEFSDKLTLLKPISSEIDNSDFDLKGEIHLIEKFLYDNSSHLPPENLSIESFSPSPIPVEDSDSLMEEIDIFLASDDLMPPGIENDDYDSERDIRFLKELLSNDPLPLPEIESSNLDHFNDPSSPRPPPEPPDVEICFDVKPDTTVKNDFEEDECFDPGGEIDVFCCFSKCEMTIPSHLSFGLLSRFSPTLWILLYFSPPGVKTLFLTPASPLRSGGTSSGWNFHVL
ncbi:hypothetical protein Tco_1195007 [Tanacetum coccineum]